MLVKTLAAACAVIVLCLGTMYGIGRWYVHTERHEPLELGVSFVPDYAESLGLDPKQTMEALIENLGVRRFRLVSYWSDIEPSPGHYDFSTLDWEFEKAEKVHAKITLALGLRQPRWPECHPPPWVDTRRPESQWQPQLEQFIAAVVKRYEDSPSLESYQLENEFYLEHFGQCRNFDSRRLIREFALVRRLDPHHNLILNRSWPFGFPLGPPQPDEFGTSIYMRVWVGQVLHGYFDYPFPAWYYSFLAGTQKLFLGKDMIIHELQAEPWPPKPIPQTSLAEQNKSMNAARLESNLEFAEATGMREIYFWGAEYWYYRKKILGDPSVWKAAREAFSRQRRSD